MPFKNAPKMVVKKFNKIASFYLLPFHFENFGFLPPLCFLYGHAPVHTYVFERNSNFFNTSRVEEGNLHPSFLCLLETNAAFLPILYREC